MWWPCALKKKTNTPQKVRSLAGGKRIVVTMRFWVRGVQLMVVAAVTTPEHFNSVIHIGSGPTPADWTLKAAALGKPS